MKVKELKYAYIIVKPHNGEYDFFQNLISFDKAALEAKCKKMNKEANAVWKKNHEKSKAKNKKPWVDILVFEVVDLDSATEALREIIHDAHRVEDESI